MFVSWSLELINPILSFLYNNFSVTKWQLISMCLVISWSTGLEAIWKIVWLPQYNFICWISQNFNTWRSCLIHTISQVAKAINLYSTSTLDWVIMLFQETIFPSMKTRTMIFVLRQFDNPYHVPVWEMNWHQSLQNNLKNMLIGLVRLNYKDDVESTKTKLRFNKEIKEHD